MISLLARLDETLVTIDISDDVTLPVDCVHLVVEDGLEVFIPVTGIVMIFIYIYINNIVNLLIILIIKI
jgi:hypothetical protein